MWYGLVVGAPGAVGGMSNFREVDRETGFLLPPSVDEWLPGQHLARFVVEVIESLDLRAMTGDYRGSVSASYHPAVLLGILVYGLRERGVFELQAGAGDVRFGGFALCRGKPASRSRHDRHVPTALCEADRRPVCAGAVAGS